MSIFYQFLIAVVGNRPKTYLDINIICLLMSAVYHILMSVFRWFRLFTFHNFSVLLNIFLLLRNDVFDFNSIRISAGGRQRNSNNFSFCFFLININRFTAANSQWEIFGKRLYFSVGEWKRTAIHSIHNFIIIIFGFAPFNWQMFLFVLSKIDLLLIWRNKQKSCTAIWRLLPYYLWCVSFVASCLNNLK